MADRNEILYAALGGRIKAFREQLNMNQDDLAEATSLSRSSISNIESGKHQPPLHKIYDIAVALNKDVFELLPSTREYLAPHASGFDIVQYINKEARLNVNGSLEKRTYEIIHQLLKNG